MAGDEILAHTTGQYLTSDGGAEAGDQAIFGRIEFDDAHDLTGLLELSDRDDRIRSVQILFAGQVVEERFVDADAAGRASFRLSLGAPDVTKRLARIYRMGGLREAGRQLMIRALSAKGEVFVLYVDDERLDRFLGRSIDRSAEADPSAVRIGGAEQGRGEVKVICFYLPQFHPFKENDEWWGQGFTEWSNLVTLKKQYPKHAAPWLPADFGFYDLRLQQVRARQAELAKLFGVFGFCYYFYWFQGRRLLNEPLDLLLADGEPDLPFCLCWANENWSRRWDGSETELLIAQSHALDEDAQLVDYLEKFFTDRRYIRINNCPLLIVYRPALIPDREALFLSWRRRAKELGFDGLYICNMMTFGDNNPFDLNCDAAIEFPPHTAVSRKVPKSEVDAPDEFQGTVYDYKDVVRNAFSRPPHAFPYFPGTMPRWDNTPRKATKSHIFHGSSPEMFEVWMRRAVSEAAAHAPAPLVFVNSWNEWAEGAHLEPDTTYGRRYLDSVRRALSGETLEEVILEDPGIVAALSREELESSVLLQARQTKLIAATAATGKLAVSAHELFAGPPPLSDDAEVIEGGSFRIELFNGRAAGTILETTRTPIINCRGWAYHARALAATQSRIALIALANHDRDGPSYHFFIDSWLARKDVAEYFKVETADNYFGFAINLSSRQLNNGRYDLAIYQFGDNVLYKGRTNQSILVAGV